LGKHNWLDKNPFFVCIKDTLFKNMELEARSGEPAVLGSYLKFVINTAQALGLQIKNRFGH